MIKGSLFGFGKLPDERSIIVVSDLHLGGREDPDTARRFCRFLEYINTGSPSVSDSCAVGEETRTGNPALTKRLFPPEKIILLGDILEIWDSRNQDRNCAFLDSMLPFLKMRDMDCDVVYVTGNHDEDVAEIIKSYDDDRKQAKEIQKRTQESPDTPMNVVPGRESGQRGGGDQPGCSPSDFGILHVRDNNGKVRPESLKMRWGRSRTFEICSRHYPSPRAQDGNLGLEVGGISYAFIHGQQFDREQITYTLSQVLGRRFDPVDFIQDLASISVTKKMNLLFPVLNVGLAIILAWLFFRPDLAPVAATIGMLSGICIVLMFLAGVYLFGYRNRDYPSSPVLAMTCAIAAVFMAGVLAIGWVSSPIVFQWLFWIPFLASLYFFCVISFPVIFAGVKRQGYNAISRQRKSPEELIKDKMFDPSKYRYDTGVLVFGHTHYADFEADTKTEKVHLLLNSGSWVREPKNEKTGDYDTFVYIDKSGVSCLRWNDEEGRVVSYCKEKDSPPAIVTLDDYILKNKVKLRD